MTSWIIATDAAVGGLVAAARQVSPTVVAVVIGPRTTAETVAASGVDQVLWSGELGDLPPEAYAMPVAAHIAAAAPLAVIAGTGTGRVFLGAVAAALDAPVLSGVTQIEVEDGRLCVRRGVLGGIASRRERVGGTCLLAVPAGEVVTAGDAAPISELGLEPPTVAKVTGVRPRTKATVNLAAAAAVVGVGRGLKAQSDLALINDLAAAAGAEVACTRPLAEGADWVAKERNVGISGQQISPDLYLAVGISGQLQHMVGVRDAKVIAAINSDPDAPIFKQCDFAVVGDLYTVVPALTAALGARS